MGDFLGDFRVIFCLEADFIGGFKVIFCFCFEIEAEFFPGDFNFEYWV